MIGLTGLVMTAALAQAEPAPAPDFDAFRQNFRAEAVAAGIEPALYDREMATATPLPSVVKANDNQPELVKPVWDYIERAVSPARVEGGREGLAAHRALLAEVEAEYGVPAETIVAIWGMESSYGRFQGDKDVLSALGTLAYDGRRQAFGREQLIGALTILQKGYADRATLKGSWAGAMGQTQFIPTTYLRHAVDRDGDGDKDIWTDHGDVFATTANYLAHSGFKADTPWGFEVAVPEGFDYALADRSVRRSLGDWMAMGVAAADGDTVSKADLNARVSIIMPAGAAGPAFAVTDSFRAILKYNNSTSYALGVARLSDALAGRDTALARDWPRGDRPLTRDEREQLQQALTDRGYAPGPVDGIVGAGTRRALRAFQRDNGLPADGYASAAMLEALTGA